MSKRNENRPGYKKTKVGWIPQEWKCLTISDVLDRVIDYRGKAPNKASYGVPLITARNIREGYIDFNSGKEFIPNDEYEEWMCRGIPKTDDVLFTTEAPLGNVAMFPERGKYALAQRVVTLRCSQAALIGKYLLYYFLSSKGHNSVCRLSTGSTALGIKQRTLKTVLIPLPSLPEQKKIAEILSTWDNSIDQTRKLIDVKKRRKKALMQQLLTGKKRLPGFSKSKGLKSYRFFDLPEDWECLQIRDVAEEYSARNTGRDKRTVLSCSKHLGFVESSEYFGKQVFSADTSNYKVIRRNYFGYPSNHIEEGSIGLLLSHDIGIVSPIYIVFKCIDSVVPEYLYAVFKTDTFRHIFAISTNASVDRRGSLRWRAFSLIRTPLPSTKEQQAIVEVLKVADNEIVQFERKLKALEKQKRGLMQRLLTGEVRVSV